jgi:glycerol kinase
MSRREVILAIDQGTTNSKALLLDAEGSVVAEASARVPVHFPRPGWVESDAMDLWRTALEAVSECLAQAGSPTVLAIGVANQRESVLAWDRATGRPLGPCVSWQCRRSTGVCDALRERGLAPLVQERSGLALDPMFSAGKARWLLDGIEDGTARARRGEVAIGTVDAWLAWNLSGGRVFATDLTNASRTQLMGLEALDWDPDLLDAFGVPREALPALRPSSAVHGTTVAHGPVPAGLPIAALVGDSHAALFGHGAPEPGAAKATYGTGTSVMAPASRPLRSAVLSSTVAWAIEPRDRPGATEVVYALEGNIPATGAALQWLAAILGREGREHELEGLAAAVGTTDGVFVVPAFTGLGAPHWDAGARGLICGLTRGTTAAHLARATFESIAWQVRDVVDALRERMPTPVAALLVDGGAMRSDLLARMQADVLGVPVLRTTSGSLAAQGAGYLAGLAVGVWESLDAIRALPRGYDRFEPAGDPAIVAAGLAGWRVALRRAASGPARPGTGDPAPDPAPDAAPATSGAEA